MKIALLINLCLLTGLAGAQSLQKKLQINLNNLAQDSQARYASVSLTVLDAKTGEQLFILNPNMGLATASTLKTITSITAFHLLGKDFQYQTNLTYSGEIDNYGTLNGDIIIKGGGDPTLGSWRYSATRENVILGIWLDAIKKAGIRRISGRVIGDDSAFGTQSIPDGWIWQDVGNYYGAGTSALCWRENQFEVKLKTGKAGTPIGVLAEVPAMPYLNFKSELLNGEEGSGDRSYAYLPVNSNTIYLRGTYAVDKTKRMISLAMADPAYDAAYRLADTLKLSGIEVFMSAESAKTMAEKKRAIPAASGLLICYLSPKLSQIVYWLNQKSINLYAEQLLKTLAYASGKKASTDNGVAIEQTFWHNKLDIDPNSINVADGSGLSPGDRVTTLTLARILQSAKREPWFNDFYGSLPVFNDMKMKSGSINNVLCYAGYHTLKGGREVCFSFMVNNYTGSTNGIREKMFKVLDVLKGW